VSPRSSSARNQAFRTSPPWRGSRCPIAQKRAFRVRFPPARQGWLLEALTMTPSAADEREDEELIARAARGDPTARESLLDRHRDRLRTMIAVRMDRRLAARVDPSDVVQESLAEAACHLTDYLLRRPLPFYPWLRQIAWEQLIMLH